MDCTALFGEAANTVRRVCRGKDMLEVARKGQETAEGCKREIKREDV